MDMVTKRKVVITPKQFLKMTQGMSFGERSAFIEKNKKKWTD